MKTFVPPARTLVATALLLAVALAGCAGDAEPALTEEHCAEQGLVLGMIEHHDPDTGEHHHEPACVEPGPPATAVITGLPANVTAYQRIEFQWVLGTSIEENHAMRTEVRVAREPAPADGTTRPDDWGERVAVREHQNFVDGQAYDASFLPAEAGSYHFRAYAEVQQTHIWSDEVVVEVGAVEPTGTVHTVTVTGGGLPAVGGLDPATLNILLGDAVAWESGDPDTYSIESTNGPVPFSATSGGEAIVFLVPGAYDYRASGTLAAAVGSYTGTINVSLSA